MREKRLLNAPLFSPISLCCYWLQVAVVALLMSGMVDAAERPEASNPDRLRVLVWNVWHGTNKVNQGAEKALQLIKDSKADICLFQESYDIKGPRGNFGPWAAKQLRWNAWQSKSPHLCVITRYKIEKQFFHHAWHGLGVQLKDDKGRKIHAFSIWLDYRSDVGMFLKENPNAKDAEILACETQKSSREKQVKALIAYLKKEQFLDLDTPLLVGGDWNCPSHLDWTKETEKALPYRRDLPLPVSKAMMAEGFTDSFRMVYPDPVKNTGNTWSPLFRKDKEVDLPMDRIDRLYYKSNRKQPLLKAVRATVYPEKLEDNAIPVRERLFPSDHAAVLIEFEWTSTK